MLLEIKDVSKTFGGLKALDRININIEQGEILSLIGPNGAGKTTLFNLITGIHKFDKGIIVFKNIVLNKFNPFRISRLGICRTFQNLRIFSNMTVLENVIIGNSAKNNIGLFESIIHSSNFYKKEREVQKICISLLEFVNLKDKANEISKNLSYGEQRRLEVARALATSPTLLLLDEPTAGMNPIETANLMELIKNIRDKGITIFLIEHDMKVVMGISDRIVVLDYGEKIAEGKPEEIKNNEKVIEAYLGKKYA